MIPEQGWQLAKVGAGLHAVLRGEAAAGGLEEADVEDLVGEAVGLVEAVAELVLPPKGARPRDYDSLHDPAQSRPVALPTAQSLVDLAGGWAGRGGCEKWLLLGKSALRAVHALFGGLDAEEGEAAGVTSENGLLQAAYLRAAVAENKPQVEVVVGEIVVRVPRRALFEAVSAAYPRPATRPMPTLDPAFATLDLLKDVLVAVSRLPPDINRDPCSTFDVGFGGKTFSPTQLATAAPTAATAAPTAAPTAVLLENATLTAEDPVTPIVTIDITLPAPDADPDAVNNLGEPIVIVFPAPESPPTPPGGVDDKTETVVDTIEFDALTEVLDNRAWCGQSLETLVGSAGGSSGSSGRRLLQAPGGNWVVVGEQITSVSSVPSAPELRCSYRTAGGEWSSEGVETAVQASGEVECRTSHLSDFAVLSYTEQTVDIVSYTVYRPVFPTAENSDCVPDPGYVFQTTQTAQGSVCHGGELLFSNGHFEAAGGGAVRVVVVGEAEGLTEGQCENLCKSNTMCSCFHHHATQQGAGWCVARAGGYPVTLQSEGLVLSRGTITASTVVYASNPCQLDPCGANGVCDAANGQCTCTNGFTGFACQFPPGKTDLCEGSACQNGGVCVAEEAGRCACPAGFVGNTCQYLDEDFVTTTRVTQCQGFCPGPMHIQSEAMGFLFLVLLIVYSLLGSAAATQLCRACLYMRRSKRGISWNLLTLEHCLLVSLCFLRAAQQAIRWAMHDGALQGGGALDTVLALLSSSCVSLSVVAFSCVIAAWAALVHYAMDKSSQGIFKKLKWPLVISSLLLFAAGTALALLARHADQIEDGYFDKDSENYLRGGSSAQAGSLAFGAAALTVGVAAGVYGFRMFKLLDKQSASSKSSNSSGNLKVTRAASTVAIRIRRAALVFMFCLALQVGAWLVPAVDLALYYEKAVAVAAVMHVSDCIGVLAIFKMFIVGVSRLKENDRSKRQLAQPRTQLASVSGSSNV